MQHIFSYMNWYKEGHDCSSYLLRIKSGGMGLTVRPRDSGGRKGKSF